MKRTERLELEELSLKAFGTKTRYKKIMERGRINDFKDDNGKPFLGVERFDVEQITVVMNTEITRLAEKARLEAEKKALEAGDQKIESAMNVIEVQNG